MALVELRGLSKTFQVRRHGGFGRSLPVRAVDRVTLDVASGETVGLVGESGCGKSTLGFTLLRLHEPTAGTIRFDGKNVTSMDRKALRAWRKEAQMIFQDPFGSLNPRMAVKDIVGEPLIIHRMAAGREIDRRVVELLETVGLEPEAAARYPYAFSGGQRQRIGIARALAAGPRFVVCDEPVSALDVSIQAQIVNLLMDLQAKFGLSYLFISHDLRLVQFMAHRVAVMYLGSIVETLPAAGLASTARHPYTQALLSAVPIPDPAQRSSRTVLEGEPPDPMHPPSGCVFHPRCPLAEERCRREVPELRPLTPVHHAACHLA